MNRVEAVEADQNWKAGDCLLVDKIPMMIIQYSGEFFLLNLLDSQVLTAEVSRNANDLIAEYERNAVPCKYLSELNITCGADE